MADKTFPIWPENQIPSTEQRAEICAWIALNNPKYTEVSLQDYDEVEVTKIGVNNYRRRIVKRAFLRCRYDDYDSVYVWGNMIESIPGEKGSSKLEAYNDLRQKILDKKEVCTTQESRATADRLALIAKLQGELKKLDIEVDLFAQIRAALEEKGQANLLEDQS